MVTNSFGKKEKFPWGSHQVPKGFPCSKYWFSPSVEAPNRGRQRYHETSSFWARYVDVWPAIGDRVVRQWVSEWVACNSLCSSQTVERHFFKKRWYHYSVSILPFWRRSDISIYLPMYLPHTRCTYLPSTHTFRTTTLSAQKHINKILLSLVLHCLCSLARSLACIPASLPRNDKTLIAA